MGKGSGIDSVKWWLNDLGIQSTDDQALAVVGAVKRFAIDHKRLLTRDEFRRIADETLAAMPVAAH